MGVYCSIHLTFLRSKNSYNEKLGIRNKLTLQWRICTYPLTFPGLQFPSLQNGYTDGLWPALGKPHQTFLGSQEKVKSLGSHPLKVYIEAR